MGKRAKSIVFGRAFGDGPVKRSDHRFASEVIRWQLSILGAIRWADSTER